MIKRPIILAGAGLLVLLGFRLGAQGVDLQALQKSEEERRKKIEKPAPVLDDQSIKNAAGKDNRFSMIVVEPGSGAPPPAAGGGVNSDDPEQVTPQQWKERKQSLEQRIADLREQIAASESQFSRMQSEYLMAGMASEQNRLKGLIDELQKAIGARKEELKIAEQGLASFLSEARRKGVQPGWLR